MKSVILVVKKGILFLMLFVISSCENGTRAFLESLNEAPVINFTVGGDILRDSFKLSSGFKEKEVSFYQINFTVADNNDNIVRIEYIRSEDLGVLLQEGDTIRGSLSLQGGNVVECQYYPEEPGEHIFGFDVVDAFDEVRSIRVNLTVLENRPPVAVFTATLVNQKSPFEYVIDASKSFDSDSSYGGRVISYEYDRLGKVTNIASSELNIVFPQAGDYAVRVRVRDNDGVWSERTEQTVQVR